jgi:hypothetical protein
VHVLYILRIRSMLPSALAGKDPSNHTRLIHALNVSTVLNIMSVSDAEAASSGSDEDKSWAVGESEPVMESLRMLSIV